MCHGDEEEKIPAKNFCSEWIKNFNKFKKKCSQQIMDKTLKEFEESANKKTDPADLIKKISDSMDKGKDCKKEQNEKLLEAKFAEFKKQANSIMKKEMDYEKNVLNAQKTKLECEDKKLNDELKKEEHYIKKIMKEFKKKGDKKNNFRLKENMMKREMKKIMNKINGKAIKII